MTVLGHELPFAVTRNQVCNAAISRHSGSKAGQFRTRRDVNRSAKQPRQAHPAKPHRAAAGSAPRVWPRAFRLSGSPEQRRPPQITVRGHEAKAAGIVGRYCNFLLTSNRLQVCPRTLPCIPQRLPDCRLTHASCPAGIVLVLPRRDIPLDGGSTKFPHLRIFCIQFETVLH